MGEDEDERKPAAAERGGESSDEQQPRIGTEAQHLSTSQPSSRGDADADAAGGSDTNDNIAQAPAFLRQNSNASTTSTLSSKEEKDCAFSSKKSDGDDDDDDQSAPIEGKFHQILQLDELVRAQTELEFRENNRTQMERAIDRMELERLKAERMVRDYQQLRRIEQDLLQNAVGGGGGGGNMNVAAAAAAARATRRGDTAETAETGNDKQHRILSGLQEAEDKVARKISASQLPQGAVSRNSPENDDRTMIPRSLREVEDRMANKIVASQFPQQQDTEDEQPIPHGTTNTTVPSNHQPSSNSTVPNNHQEHVPRNLLQTLTNRALDTAVNTSTEERLGPNRQSFSLNNSGSDLRWREAERNEAASQSAAAQPPISSSTTDPEYISLGRMENGQPQLVVKRRDFKCIVILMMIIILVIVASICLLLFWEESPFVDDDELSGSGSVPDDVDDVLQTMEQNLFLQTRQALLDPATVQAEAMAWIKDGITKNEESFLEWELRQRFALATIYLTLYGILPDHETDECDWFAEPGACHPETGEFQKLELTWNATITEGIPIEVGLLSQLRRLDIEISTDPSNAPLPLESFLPTHLAAAPMLDELQLSRLGLVGTLPPYMGNWTALVNIYLEENQLSGTLPTEIGLWSNLQFLNLAQNNFTGRLPTELGLCQQLVELRLNDNAFTGDIPSELCENDVMIIADCNSGNFSCC